LGLTDVYALKILPFNDEAIAAMLVALRRLTTLKLNLDAENMGLLFNAIQNHPSLTNLTMSRLPQGTAFFDMVAHNLSIIAVSFYCYPRRCTL
jgi:hypothetical protein